MNPLYGIATWVLIGALAGWVAAIVARTHSAPAHVRSLIVGVVGAVGGGLLARDVINTSGLFSTRADTPSALGHAFVALLGSIALLVIVRLFSQPDRGVLHHR